MDSDENQSGMRVGLSIIYKQVGCYLRLIEKKLVQELLY